jgi:small-conductance mechanosensitive channel
MSSTVRILIACLGLTTTLQGHAQTDTLLKQYDALNHTVKVDYQNSPKEIDQEHMIDSLRKVELQRQLQEISDSETRNRKPKSKIDSLFQNYQGYPVIGLLNDTLFYIYAKFGAFTPQERAVNISKKLDVLYHDNSLNLDSITSAISENTINIVYGEIIMSISESDALWNNISAQNLADRNVTIIKNAIIKANEENSVLKYLKRIGLVVLILTSAWLFIWLIGKNHFLLRKLIERNKSKFQKDTKYKNNTILTGKQKLKVLLFIATIFRWFFIAITLYIVFPLIFSIYPFTHGWSDKLFNIIWLPLKGGLLAIWVYLPKLFKILVIIFAMHYVLRLVKYIFSEIAEERLTIKGFYADWSRTTYSIVRFLLYAFTMVLIYPLLPGSDSVIFQGVSIFIGVILSLGSSTAIANMVAGLVITFMRPFKIGDRIKIGTMSGDVIEKNLLVIRLKSLKNEEITIPNSAVLSEKTANYSFFAKTDGLIIHSTVTIGYDVLWKEMYQVLIDAALKTDLIMHEPKPFVLQTSLDDFYVSYQINAYTQESNKQAVIYSNLHQNIQDICNERGIEILSPHYRAERDGNRITIPANYLDKDHKASDPNNNINTDET